MMPALALTLWSLGDFFEPCARVIRKLAQLDLLLVVEGKAFTYYYKRPQRAGPRTDRQVLDAGQLTLSEVSNHRVEPRR